MPKIKIELPEEKKQYAISVTIAWFILAIAFLCLSKIFDSTKFFVISLVFFALWIIFIGIEDIFDKRI